MNHPITNTAKGTQRTAVVRGAGSAPANPLTLMSYFGRPPGFPDWPGWNFFA
jgi:hypothetical protein